ncbi:MAG: secondary thiamine-phosphate synthase enzyme YjbQ [archaeon]|nr:secondary thiamine-phosphate synthase enzyme YjbQ [archaeon]
MGTKFYELQIKTTQKIEFVDMTKKVEEKIKDSKIKNGIVVVYSPHATACVKIMEKEAGILKDYPVFFSKLAPVGAGYIHDSTAPDKKPNTPSHLIAALMNQSETMIINEGKLVYGTWNTLFLVELDGGRDRKVFIQILGD